MVIEGRFGRTYPIQLELYVPAYVFLGLLIGLSEESAFRGYILKNIQESLKDADAEKFHKPVIAIFLSSVLFGVYHVYFVGSGTLDWWMLYVLQALTGGIFMGFLYLETDNLLGPITYHSAIIMVGNTIPWTWLSSPHCQLIIATITNIVQTVILEMISLVKKTQSNI